MIPSWETHEVSSSVWPVLSRKMKSLRDKIDNLKSLKVTHLSISHVGKHSRSIKSARKNRLFLWFGVPYWSCYTKLSTYKSVIHLEMTYKMSKFQAITCPAISCILKGWFILGDRQVSVNKRLIPISSFPVVNNMHHLINHTFIYAQCALSILYRVRSLNVKIDIVMRMARDILRGARSNRKSKWRQRREFFSTH